MSAHTKGPWQVNSAQETVHGFSEEGEAIVVVYELGTNEADHKLIAAAPELLVALEAAESAMSHPVHAFEVLAEHSVVREMIRAAIAKATGAT